MDGAWDAVATRKVHPEKNAYLKSVQENILKIVTKVTRSDGGI